MKKILLAAAITAALSTPALADHSLAPLSENNLSRNADFVFLGTVASVDYRRAESADSVRPGTPHTFVTYKIEKIFKGKSASDTVTLRFVGGRGDKSQFLMASNIPMFDAGERDMLFVRGNAKYACPLVECARGRVRVIDGMAFNDEGQALEQSPVQAKSMEWGFGPYVDLIEVNTHKVSQTELRKHHDLPEGEGPAPRGAKSLYQLSLDTLATRVADAVARVNTPDELAKLAPVASADIKLPFKAVIAREVAAPLDAGVDTAPALINTANDKLEVEAISRNGGNPVIK